MMICKCWLTEYEQFGFTYGSYVMAIGLVEAAALVKLRGLGEVIVGQRDKRIDKTWVNMRRVNNDKRKLHYLTFLAFVAVRSNVGDINAVFGDRGWFHEYVHIKTLDAVDVMVTMDELDKLIFLNERRLGFVEND